MQNRFCLNAATIKKAQLERQIHLAASAGFGGIGLWLDDIEAAQSQGTSIAMISKQIEEAGLKVDELCFLGGWQDAEDAAFHGVLQSAERICEVSRSLGCDIVVTVPAPAAGSLAGAPARFRSICKIAAKHGVRMALEFPGTAEEVNNLASAWKLVSAADCQNGGLVLDSFHFYLGGSRLDDLDRTTVEKIFLVHLSDAMAVSAEKLKTHHDYRTFPGEGTLRLGPLLERLQDLGYEGVYSLEIWNQRLAAAAPADLAQRGIESLIKLQKGLSTYAGGPRFSQ